MNTKQHLEITPDNVAAVMQDFLEPEDLTLTGDTEITAANYDQLFPRGTDDMLALSGEFKDEFGVILGVQDLPSVSARIQPTSDSVEIDFSDEREESLATIADIARVLQSLKD